MAARTTVCPGCEGAVPRGRLSCPSCGLLLASVAGAPRRRSRSAPVTASAPVGPTVEPAARHDDPSSVTDEPSLPPPAGAYIPPASTPGPFLMPARAWAGLSSAARSPMAGFGSVSQRPMSAAGGSAAAGSISLASSMPDARIATRTEASVALEDDGPDEAVEAGWLEATAGWLMIIGSAVAMLGFLLPWSSAVIGAEGAGTYFDTWGIASPSHILVVLALAAGLGMAIVQNPIPTWIRTCAVGLGLGGLLVGLSWPYLLGPLGAGPGVLSILVGGLMLGTAGILDLVEARHALPGQSV